MLRQRWLDDDDRRRDRPDPQAVRLGHLRKFYAPDLRPGRQLVGYDLLSTPPLRLLHQDHGDGVPLIRLPELRVAARDLPVDAVGLTPTLAGLVVRFTLQKAGGAR